jgi:hypothetical protein
MIELRLEDKKGGMDEKTVNDIIQGAKDNMGRWVEPTFNERYPSFNPDCKCNTENEKKVLKDPIQQGQKFTSSI